MEPRLPWRAAPLQVPSRIIFYNPSAGDQPPVFGVSCHLPLALGDEHSLEDYLLEQRYPNVMRVRTDVHYENVWKLMRQAFRTLTPPDDAKRGPSVVTWKKASWSRTPINRLYLLHDDSQSVGTIAASRFYSKTWLIHQLGVNGDRAQVLSHQLYGRVLDYLRHTDEARYTVGCWPKDSRVFERYYVDFIRNDPFSDCHFLEATNILEFNVPLAAAHLAVLKTPSIFEIAPMRRAEQPEVLADLARHYPPFVLQAFDLREFDILLSDVRALYERVTLQRRRVILTARFGQKLQGYVIAEWGSEDQNIFNLFDNFRIFVLPDVDDKKGVENALLSAALRTYAEHNIRHALCWSKDPNLIRSLPGGKVFHDAYFWVADAVRMKAFMRHLDRLHGRIDTIRGSRRGSREARA